MEEREQQVAADHTHLARRVAVAMAERSKEASDGGQKLRETLEVEIKGLEKVRDTHTHTHTHTHTYTWGQHIYSHTLCFLFASGHWLGAG